MHIPFTLGLISLVAALANAACSNPQVRREWGELSSGEKASYVAAIKALAQRQMSNQYTDPSRMSYHDFTRTHVDNAFFTHANAEFLVYHRAMLLRFDQAMQSVGWYGGVIYFDEAGRQSNWQNSDAFSSQYFGSVGQKGQCLADGQFSAANGFTTLNSDAGDMKCLVRCGGGSFWGPQDIATIISGATSYHDIQYDDTANFHANGHFTFGGAGCDMADPYWSPRDPIFYFHHAYVDKIYWKWQTICPQYIESYNGNYRDGVNSANPGSGSALPVSPYTPLDSWGGLTAADMFDTRNDLLCYTYSKSASDIPYSHQACPDGSSPNLDAWAARAAPKPAPVITTTTTTTTTTSVERVTSAVVGAQTTTTVGEPVTSTTTTTAFVSTTMEPTSTIASTTSMLPDVDLDNWFFDDLRALIRPTLRFVNVQPPSQQSQSKKRRHDSMINTMSPNSTNIANTTTPTNTTTIDPPENDLFYISSSGPNNTTLVTVSTDSNLETYTIPSGCQLHKVFEMHISVTPLNYNQTEGLPKDNPCPLMIHAPCVETKCERYPGFTAPLKTSPCQYPRVMSDYEIEIRKLDRCVIRASDCRMKWRTDECNAKFYQEKARAYNSLLFV